LSLFFKVSTSALKYGKVNRPKFLSYYYLAVAFDVLGHLARQDVSEGGEGVVHRLVVNGLVQVLDEHVAHARPVDRKANITREFNGIFHTRDVLVRSNLAKKSAKSTEQRRRKMFFAKREKERRKNKRRQFETASINSKRSQQ
jgi:hypothetical protein